MKRYLISLFIPYLLLYLSGCYSLQKVTKDEFFMESENPDMILRLSDREEVIFNEGNYSIINDSIKGVGKSKIKTGKLFDYSHFEGSISINDVKEVKVDKFDLAATIVLILAIYAAVGAIYYVAASGLKDFGKQVGESLK